MYIYNVTCLDCNIKLHSTENDYCSKCVELQVELDLLTKRILPENGKIPEELWNMFPPKGQYLKNILIYSGYETYEFIITLKEQTEVDGMISFIKDMSDIIDEKEGDIWHFLPTSTKTNDSPWT